jgi:hypothetical protein
MTGEAMAGEAMIDETVIGETPPGEVAIAVGLAGPGLSALKLTGPSLSSAIDIPWPNAVPPRSANMIRHFVFHEQAADKKLFPIIASRRFSISLLHTAIVQPMDEVPSCRFVPRIQ